MNCESAEKEKPSRKPLHLLFYLHLMLNNLGGPTSVERQFGEGIGSSPGLERARKTKTERDFCGVLGIEWWGDLSHSDGKSHSELE